jgi:hypothetical protein
MSGTVLHTEIKTPVLSVLCGQRGKVSTFITINSPSVPLCSLVRGVFFKRFNVVHGGPDADLLSLGYCSKRSDSMLLKMMTCRCKFYLVLYLATHFDMSRDLWASITSFTTPQLCRNMSYFGVLSVTPLERQGFRLPGTKHPGHISLGSFNI